MILRLPPILFLTSKLIVNRAVLEARLVLRDGSVLVVRTSFDYQAAVREFDYAYICYDAQSNRIFQYDDSPHHPEIATHPHHLHRGVKSKKLPERIEAIDVPRVDFITIVSKVIAQLKKEN